MLSKKIAFVKIGEFSHINKRLLESLDSEFSDYKIEVIDVRNLANKKDIFNIFFTIKEYGLDILLGRKNVGDCLSRTTYLFHKVKNYLSHRLDKGEYVFTFQTQSLFDASVPGIPHFVYTDHTHLANLQYLGFQKKDLFPSSWIELEKTIYQNARLIFTMSTNISKSLIEQYSCSPDKVVCVFAGSNSGLVETTTKKTYLEKNILFVGVDWERKGGPELVEAFKVLLKVHPDAHLTIVGCSPQVNVPNCNVVGRVPIAEVNKYYEKASIFCLPTKQEPFGIVFIEALNNKLPIVATRIGAVPDFVVDAENGYLVEPGNVQQLAQALIDLVGNPQKLQEFGEKGYRIASERYTWKNTTKNIKDNIEKVILSEQ